MPGDCSLAIVNPCVEHFSKQVFCCMEIVKDIIALRNVLLHMAAMLRSLILGDPTALKCLRAARVSWPDYHFALRDTQELNSVWEIEPVKKQDHAVRMQSM